MAHMQRLRNTDFVALKSDLQTVQGICAQYFVG